MRKINEDGYFALENLRHNRLEKEIDRAQIVAAKQLFIAAISSEEQNGRMPRAFAGSYHLGCLKSVHVKHTNIEYDRRKIIVQAQTQSDNAGRSKQQSLH